AGGAIAGRARQGRRAQRLADRARRRAVPAGPAVGRRHLVRRQGRTDRSGTLAGLRRRDPDRRARARPFHGKERLTMSKTILTVDDSRTIREMLKAALLEAGMEVYQAEDGVHGL